MTCLFKAGSALIPAFWFGIGFALKLEWDGYHPTLTHTHFMTNPVPHQTAGRCALPVLKIQVV